MVAAAERAGHKCILFVYDRHGGDIARHESTIRSFWPWMVAEVRDARDGLSGVDAYVASSWETAHVLASRAVDSAARLYFIQDFEPYFHPRGTVYALAEDSYRFGFRNVALGEFVAKELELRGIASEMVPYGCDTSIYRLDNVDGVRSGVVYYTKPGSDRRGYLLGKLALEEFHRRHPEHPIHLYGDASDTWEIPTVRHGRLSPGQLNELYNGTVSGLAISFTNISLVAEELLAAGNVPVVTDVPFARDDLTNPHVEWAQATAGGLADALCRGVENAPGAQERRSMSSSVRQGWTYTEDALIAIIADAVRTGELVR
jgi:glycosyltransferase involved in cell wall biosynthesis